MSESFIPIKICIKVDLKPMLFDRLAPIGSTVQDALNEFSRDNKIDVFALLNNAYSVSIFGKSRSFDTVLQAGDRIEICGPLIATPMDSRRLRAKREHKGGKM